MILVRPAWTAVTPVGGEGTEESKIHKMAVWVEIHLQGTLNVCTVQSHPNHRHSTYKS